jgi:hypothetical protein
LIGVIRNADALIRLPNLTRLTALRKTHTDAQLWVKELIGCAVAYVRAWLTSAVVLIPLRSTRTFINLSLNSIDFLDYDWSSQTSAMACD